MSDQIFIFEIWPLIHTSIYFMTMCFSLLFYYSTIKQLLTQNPIGDFEHLEMRIFFPLSWCFIRNYSVWPCFYIVSGQKCKGSEFTFLRLYRVSYTQTDIHIEKECLSLSLSPHLSFLFLYELFRAENFYYIISQKDNLCFAMFLMQ